MTHKNQAPEGAERAAFEAAAVRFGWPATAPAAYWHSAEQDYSSNMLSSGWAFWQARAALAAQPQAAPAACTCPSGEGSLRWPCPAHPAPAEGDAEMRDRLAEQMQAKADNDQRRGALQPVSYYVRSALGHFAAANVQPKGTAPNVDQLAQFIRQIDRRNNMGAGALAEKIVEWLAAQAPAVQERTPSVESEGYQQRLAQARQDSGRLDWLSENALSMDAVADPDNLTVVFYGTDPCKQAYGRTLRAAIDAAMKSEPPVQNKEL